MAVDDSFTINKYGVNDLSSTLIASEVDKTEKLQELAPFVECSTNSPKKTAQNLSSLKQYKCKSCKYVSRSSGNLSRHNRSKHIGILHSCALCNKRFKSLYILREHIRSVHRGETFICEICSNAFNYKVTLAKHKRVVHDKTSCYKCNFCGRKFYEKEHYHGHVNGHIKVTPFKCQTCGSSYAFGSSLRRHRQSCGTMRKIHKCTTCETIFSSKVCLDDHVIGKHGTKDKLCACGKRFSWRSSFTRHQKKCKVVNLKE